MMRESLARAAVVGTTLSLLGAVAAFAAVQQRGIDTPPSPAPERTVVEPAADPDAPPSPTDRGRAVYAETGCATCHSVAGQGSPRFPLDGVGSRLSPQEIRLWIVAPQQIRPGVRKPAYDHLGEDDLEALIAYVETL